MGLGSQFANVVEWSDFDEEMLFWKWPNSEIKKGSRLIIRPGQDAIFMYNGKTEGIFRDEGSFDIESQIIPFLSTLKGFRFGFNSGLRAEVLFVNTKEITGKWGTKNAILIPAQGLPGGMPVRAFGTFTCKVSDDQVLIEKVAGVKSVFTVTDVKDRIVSKLDQLLMKHIVQEGQDMFHLQAFAGDIGRGIQTDLDYELCKIGIGITDFSISSVSYPEEIQRMAEKAASQSMVGDMNKYQQMAMADALSSGNSAAGNTAGAMAGIGMGMAMGQQMASQFRQASQDMRTEQSTTEAGPRDIGFQQKSGSPSAPEQGAGGKDVNFCPNCGTKVNGAKFCPNCGTKLC